VKTIKVTLHEEAVIEWLTSLNIKPPNKKDITMKSGVNTAYLVCKELDEIKKELGSEHDLMKKLIAAGLDGAR
jgi:hypothetical protein